MTFLYRYSDRYGTICLDEFRVTRETPAGKWIDDYGRKRFVLNDSHKRFAWPTKEEARVSFIARKARQLRILTVQTESVRAALDIAKAKTVEQLGSYFRDGEAVSLTFE